MLDVLIEKVPYIAALIVVVMLFLRHLEKRDTQNNAMQSRAIDCIDRNSEKLGEVSASLRGCASVQRQCAEDARKAARE